MKNRNRRCLILSLMMATRHFCSVPEQDGLLKKWIVCIYKYRVKSIIYTVS